MKTIRRKVLVTLLERGEKNFAWVVPSPDEIHSYLNLRYLVAVNDSDAPVIRVSKKELEDWKTFLLSLGGYGDTGLNEEERLLVESL